MPSKRRWSYRCGELFFCSLLCALVLSPSRAFGQWRASAEGGEDWYSVWGAQDDVYMVGARGRFLRSQDGGRSWSLSDSGTSEPLYAVFSPGGGVLFAVGASGTALLST